MRVILSSILMIFCALSAGAADFITMNLADNSSRKVLVPVLTAKECENRLTSMFSLKLLIQNSLDALNSINASAAAKERIACISDALKGAPYKTDEMENTVFDDSPYSIQNYHLQLPSQPSDKSADEWQKKTAVLYAELEAIPMMLAGVSKVDSSEVTLLREQMHCYNPYPPGTSSSKYVISDYGKQCEGKWLDKAGKEALESKLIDLQKKKSALEDEYYKSSNGMRAAIGEKLKNMVADDSLHTLFKTYTCFNPHEPGSSNFTEFYQYGAGAQCTDNKPTKKEALEAQEKIKALFSSAKSDLAGLEEKLKKQKEEKYKIHLATVADKIDSYSRERLLARYKAYLRSGGDTAKYSEFCQQYAKNDVQDKIYSESGYSVPIFNSEIDWKFAQEHGVSEAELQSIRDYSGSYYNTINRAIWSKSIDSSKEMQNYKKTMDAGLAKLPAYTSTPVTRYANLPEQSLQEHKVGSVVNYAAYTSTSKKQNWYWNGRHSFVIYTGKNGKYIDDISLNQSEEEVLFNSGTKFKILAKRKSGSSVFFVMVEVDEKGNPIAKVPNSLHYTDGTAATAAEMSAE